MTVKNLMSRLSKFPENMEVYLCSESEFRYAPAEDVYEKEIPFSEEPGGRELAREKVIIIDTEF